MNNVPLKGDAEESCGKVLRNITTRHHNPKDYDLNPYRRESKFRTTTGLPYAQDGVNNVPRVKPGRHRSVMCKKVKVNI